MRITRDEYKRRYEILLAALQSRYDWWWDHHRNDFYDYEAKDQEWKTVGEILREMRDGH